MASLGDLLLGLTGHKDPKADMIKSILGPAMAQSAAGAPPPAQLPGAGGGVATPPGAASPAATDAPAPGQPPPRSPLYDSPPDLIKLYDQLSDFQRRQKSVDNGLGMLASTVVQPQNREFAQNMFASGDQPDPLSLTMQLQNFQSQQADANKKRAEDLAMRTKLPAIAKQYGLNADTAQLLYDSGELDQFVLEAAKPDNEVITDDTTGQQRLVNKKTGETVSNLGGGLKPTADQQEFAAAKQAGELPEGVTTFPQYQEWLANVKKPTTTINNNIGDKSAAALVTALDQPTITAVQKASESVGTITGIQNARKSLADPSGVLVGSDLSAATQSGRKIIAQIFGLDDKASDNTDVLMSQLKENVLPRLKALYPVTDTDRKYVEQMVGSSQNLTAPVINRIIDIMEKGERKSILDANSRMQSRIDAIEDPGDKKAAQASFDSARYDPPAYDDVYLSHIAPDDLQALKDGKVKPDEFDKVYGPGIAAQILGSS